MIFSLTYFLIVLIGLIIATYTDLKERIIPNKLNYSLIILGLGLHLIESFIKTDISFFVLSLGIGIASFIGAYLLYKLGMWAGGDVKLFAGIGTLLTFNPFFLGNFLNIPLFQPINLPIFPLTLFIFSVFSMLPYGIILIVKNLRKKPKLKNDLFLDFKTKIPGLIVSSAIFSGVIFISQFNSLIVILLPIILIALIFIKFKLKTFIGLILFGWFLINKPIESIYSFGSFLTIFTLGYILFKVYSLGPKALRHKVKIEELEDGMIPADTIYLENNEVKISSPINFMKIISLAIKGKQKELNELIKPKKNIIISSRKAGGIELNEIKKLKEFAEKGLIKNEIWIKDSAPMVPAILIGFIVLNIVGDLLWNVIL